MAKKKVYVVGKNKSVLAKGGIHLKPGEVVEVGKHLPEEHLEALVRDGFVKLKGSRAADEDEDETPVPDEIDTDAKNKGPDPLSVDPTASAAEIKGATARLQAEKIAEAKKAGGAPTTPWILNPDKLKIKSLPDLNTMIRERMADGPQFDDREQAIQFLSSDFKRK